MANREDEITGLLKQLQNILGQLMPKIAIESLSFSTVRDDITNLTLQKQKLLQEMEAVKQSIKDTQASGDKIIAEAREKIKDIEQAAKENLAGATIERSKAAAIRKELEGQKGVLDARIGK